VPDAAVATPAVQGGVVATFRVYLALTKPNIIWLLLITTVPAMVVANGGWPSTWLVVATLVGGSLAAGGANALNQFAESDIDALMKRTRNRPLPSGAVTPRNAAIFGVLLGVAAAVWMVVLVNILAAALAIGALAFYAIVYTLYLKRSTVQNIVIGGAAGAAPPLIGWAAVTGTVEIASLLLFLVVFYWTPAHFWALSLFTSDDYAAAGVPMLPVVRGVDETKRQILLYSFLLVAVTIIFGAAVSTLQEDRKNAVLNFFNGVNDASMVVINWVMVLAPYAVFALISAIVATFGLDLLRSLITYALVVVVGLALHVAVTYSLAARFLAGLNPLAFYRSILKAPLIAFSTSSSNATLPVTMETAEDEVGVSKEVSSFVLPLGATINMDGTALYQAVAVMFIAQIYGIPLGFGAQLTVVLTATLASIGAAGVPSAGIITLIIVLQSVGLGDQVEVGIALILGVDRILDMLRTSVNVTGDITAAAVIAKSEGETLAPAVSVGGPT